MKKRRKKRKNKIDTLRIVALLIIILVIAHFYVSILSPRLLPFYMRLGVLEQPINILVLGTDMVFDRVTHKVISDVGHNDTIIVLRVDPIKNKINMLSIPRDTLADIPEYGKTKINAAHFIGGPDLAIKTVSAFLGIQIDGFVVLHPKGIITLIDAIGGIKMYVDKDMYYVDKVGGLNINLKKGWQTLSGEEANGFLRFRMDPLGDINRIQRQQGFAEALIKNLVQPQNIWKIPIFASIAKENIKTSLPLKTIFKIGNFARYLTKDDIRMMLVPGDFSEESEEACFWLSNSEETEKILGEYFGKQIPTKEKSANIKKYFYVSIFNNTDKKEKTFPLLRKLANTNYVVSNISLIKRGDYNSTLVIAQKGNLKGARGLAKFLNIDKAIVSSAGDVISDFTIILCDDYENSLIQKD